MELLFAFLLLMTYHLCFLVSGFETTTVTNGTTDHLVLLSVKSQVIDDPSGALNSWGNRSFPNFCQRYGATCGLRGQRRGRVTALNLPGLNLSGLISPAIANLTFLKSLHLPKNQLYGSLPHELGLLLQLNHLDLSFNSLNGEIPSSLSYCSNLRNISLGFNDLQGGIPLEIGSLVHLQSLSLLHNNLTGPIPADSFQKLQKLELLSLAGNKLSGIIPPSLGNLSALTYLLLNNNSLTGFIPPSLSALSSLTKLGLAWNNLTGDIPPSLGNLSSLLWLDFGYNYLTGGIPTSLGNLYSLTLLALQDNQLSGPLPPSLGNLRNISYLNLEFNNLTGRITSSVFNLSSLQLLSLLSNNLEGSLPADMGNRFPQLEYLDLSVNELHGSIPSSLCNSTKLRDVGLEYNLFSGTIPPCLGHLQGLYRLGLGINQLEARSPTDWSFLTALANCSILSYLGLAGNKLEGHLPSSLANLSTTLQIFFIDYNNIEGSMPEGIGNLFSLSQLAMGGNLLHGTIPVSLGRLNILQHLEIGQNRLEGQIPSSIGNLTQLNKLDLGENLLTGNIPSSLVNCQLNWLDLHGNKLTGVVPKEILQIPTLSDSLHLQDNMLAGPLPPEVGGLKNLEQLDISKNRITGEIPNSLGDCEILGHLNMSMNFFQGPIPSSLSKLRGLQLLDLSCNSLSSHIPEFFGSFPILYLNLSFNDFEGEVPKEGIFQNLSAFSITGNNRLCGGIPELGLAPCPDMVSRKHQGPKLVLIIPLIAAIVCCILLFSLLVLRFRRRRSLRDSSPLMPAMNDYPRVSYSELARATNGFSSTNLLGVGSFGSVYRGLINWDGNDSTVAVKVLHLQQQGASRSFVAECEALRCVRHRNLMKILTVCSGIDSRGNDFKALIFEFLPNGNLEKWLHNREEGKQTMLDFNQRVSTAIDVASALDYLHHHKPRPIVHCDLKPSNVLLDNDLVAHVGDFGLARFLCQDANSSSQNSTSWGALRGTIGYVAPEYGIGNEVSIYGDIYSYGILLLELFTAKRPTDDAFKEDLSLHQYVEMALPDKAIEVIDQSLLSAELPEQHGVEAPDMPNSREVEIACITSALRVGILCSKEAPTERMQISDALRELQRIRDKMFLTR